VAVGLAGILLALVLLLLHREPHRSGTDRTPADAFVVKLAGGQQACQGQELLPLDTAAVQLTIATGGQPGPPLSVSLRDARGRVLTQGALAAGWRQGAVTVPVEKVRRASSGDEICVHDGARPGSAAMIGIAGDSSDPGYEMTVAGSALSDFRVRVDYLRPGRESWLQMVPVVAHRLTLGKSGLIRHWVWIGAPLLMLMAIVLAALLAGGAWEERGTR
jgi:hypothetical protein